MQIPFIGGAYEGRSKSINAQRSINIFPVYDSQEAKAPIAMYGTPGNTVFCDTENEAISRGFCVLGTKLYTVVGNTVYEITTAGVETSLGTITTSTGHVGMASNGNEILISDGTSTGYLITPGSPTTLAAIASANYFAAADCVFFDGYFVVIYAASGRIAISSAYDGTAWDALDYATAESNPDGLVGIATTKQNIWLLGEISGEVYYNSGNADFTFARVPGAIIDIGCRAVSSIVEIDGKIFWLSNKNTIVKTNGYGFLPVSTPGIEYQISTYTTQSDAKAFTYTLEGRTFYAINFPTHDKTWVLDIDSGQWHEWQSLNSEGTSGQFRGVTGVSFNNKALIGDRTNGKIYTLSLDSYLDNSLEIKRTRRAQIIHKERYNILHHKIEIDFESGVGLNVESDVDGYDPQVTLSWSDDEGNTWSSGLSVSLGKYEEYTKRQVWRRLGKSKNRIYQLVIQEPVKVVILGQYAELVSCKV